MASRVLAKTVAKFTSCAKVFEGHGPP
jgi:hypothetical protein